MKVNQVEGEHHNGQQAEQQQSNSKFLSRIKKLVILSNADMLQLIEDEQKFVNKIVQFNQISYENMKLEENQKALIYLQQAEKVLEYAASCGKTIDRFLIISTLHNEATVFHKLLQFNKSYDYMQAILFNMNLYFQYNQNISINEEIANHQSSSHKLVSSFVYRKINTVVYHLQFSAVCSQIDKHDLAIQSAKKALAELNSILGIQMEYAKFFKLPDTQIDQLRNVIYHCLGLHRSKVKQFHKKIRTLINHLRQNQQNDKCYQKLKKFSIGEVMQMQPISVAQASEFVSIENLVSPNWLAKVTFYVSIAYYTIATQMRLEARKNYINAQQSQKFQKSKIFHLNSIVTAFQHISFVSDYHQHIIKSFKTNYHIDLNSQQSQKQLQKIQQSALKDQNYFYKGQSSMRSSQQQKTVKKQAQIKPPRLKRISSQSIDKVKVPSFAATQIKQKKKKSKAKEHQTLLHSRQILNKNKIQIHKLHTQKSEKKLITVASSRTKLGKASKHDEHDKARKGNSNQKTKDQSKKKLDNKAKNQKRIRQQYMTFPDKIEQKKHKNVKKTQNQSRSKSKNSKSKGRNSFLSPRQTNQNYGIRSYK